MSAIPSTIRGRVFLVDATAELEFVYHMGSAGLDTFLQLDRDMPRYNWGCGLVPRYG